MIVIVLLVAAAAYLVIRGVRRDRGSQPELAALGWVAGTRWDVVAPLARVELRRLVFHPATIAGVALVTPLMVALSLSDTGTRWERASQDIALALVPFGWFVIVAAHLLTTRPLRTNNADLFASLPAPQPVRTTALNATMIGPFLVVVAMAAVAVAYASTIDRLVGSPDLAELAAGALIGAGAVTVGVSVARFLPHPIFGLAGPIAVILIQVRFLEVNTWPWNKEEAHPIRFFGFLASNTSAPPELEYRPAGWHLVYLLGLIAMMAVVALTRNGVPRPVAGALAAAIGVAAFGGWMQTRPAPEARVAEMVRYLEQPAEFQTCTDRASGRYCVFRDGARHVAGWDAVATAVRALAPVEGKALEVRERVATVVSNSNCSPVPFRDGLVKQVAQRIDPARVWAKDSAIHPGTDTLPCSSESVRGYFFATQVGAWAVGLPSSPHGLDERCYADGEARAAIALWLGVAATPEYKRRLTTMVNEESSDHLRFSGWTDPPMWGVHFAVADARVALAMLDRPRADVAAALRAHWARLTAPGTPVSELSTLFGLPAIATPSGEPFRTCG